MPGSGDDVDDRQAKRVVVLAVFALLLFVVGGVVALTVPSRVRPASSEDPAVRSEGAADVGPVPGVGLASYIRRRTKALASVRGQAVAVASLDRYVTEPVARQAVGGLEVLALLVAPAGGSPAAVEGPLAAWAADQRTQVETERRDLQTMIDTSSDPDFKATFRADIDRLGKVLAALDPAGPVVFGVVVRAPADALRNLARSNGVRLVDVVGPRPPPDLARLGGLRPEETEKAGRPPTRPL